MPKTRRGTKNTMPQGICDYCGAEGDVSKEHIFASTLFRARRTNPITLYACTPCHRRKTRGEDGLHDMAYFAHGGRMHDDAVFHLGKTARSTNYGSSRLGRSFVDDGQDRLLVDARTGQPVEVVHAIPTAAVDHDVDVTIGFIIRGLFIHLRGDRLPAGHPMAVERLEQTKAYPMVRDLHRTAPTNMGWEGDRVVRWAWWATDDEPRNGIWLLTFAEAIQYLGATGRFAGEGDRRMDLG